jgi:hypothetical protein
MGRWLPIIDTDKNRGKITDEELTWDPLRNYDKPWLDSAPLRYGHKKKGKKKKKKGKKKGKKGKKGAASEPDEDSDK